MTVAEMIISDKTMLTADDVYAVLGKNPQALREQARRDVHQLGFPAMYCGCTLSIPRKSFLKWLGEI